MQAHLAAGQQETLQTAWHSLKKQEILLFQHMIHSLMLELRALMRTQVHFTVQARHWFQITRSLLFTPSRLNSAIPSASVSAPSASLPNASDTSPVLPTSFVTPSTSFPVQLKKTEEYAWLNKISNNVVLMLT